MKRTTLEKLKGVKISDRVARAVPPGRFAQDSAVLSRREQRRLDQAKGLVPFAVKLDSALVQQIQALAAERNADLNDVVAELLRKGMGG